MNETKVMKLVSEVLGVLPLSATHQTFGHNSVTFDVRLPERNVILRTNPSPTVFATTEQNLTVLASLGLPVPQVIASDLTLSHYPCAWMLLDKIPGRDLRYELNGMRPEQMTSLAEQIVDFQRRVMSLPQGKTKSSENTIENRYGYVGIGEIGPYTSWWELVCSDALGSLTSEARFVSRFDTHFDTWLTRIRKQMRAFEPYFRSVPPTCFLDDITVKNVIVQNRELQGLVDFDCVCYGDPLYWLALTATGVVSDVGEAGQFYVEELKRLWELTPDQERVLALYSAIMSLDFLRRSSAQETPEWNARMWSAVETWMRVSEQG